MNEQTSLNGPSIRSLRALAKKMYVVEGHTAKAISLQIGVTQKTLGAWVKKFKWKEAIEHRYDLAEKTVIITDLRDYLIRTNPKLSKEIEQSITNYLLLKAV